MIEDNQGAPVAPQASEGEAPEPQEETITLKKSEYDSLNQTLGSLKRENKDLKKPKDPEPSQKSENKPEESVLQQKLERIALRQAGVTHPDDIELAQKTAKKWGVDIDEVLEDDDFKVKLERQQTQRANADATSNIKGDKGGGTSQKDTPAYWIAKGTPPTADQVPNRKTRATIARAMMANAKSGKTFYND